MTQKSFRKLQKEVEKTAHDLKMTKDPRERKKILRKFRELIEESDQILLHNLPRVSYQRLIERHDRG